MGSELLSVEEQTTDYIQNGERVIPRLTAEYWTSRQRQANRLHEISYRACFKPQLVKFFIDRFSKEGDTVFDPFAGRGTTLLEAVLNRRHTTGNDINPLSRVLCLPRLSPPTAAQVEKRLAEIPFDKTAKADCNLSMFYHPDTEAELVSLQQWLYKRREDGSEDNIDRFIRMVATNRLSGHSKGFFSVYTLPPNQAASPERQLIINKRRNQKPEYRNVPALIAKKARNLLSQLDPKLYNTLHTFGNQTAFYSSDAANLDGMADNSIQLTVTSPPFVNIVQYDKDNWLRLWFNRIDAGNLSESLRSMNKVTTWQQKMSDVLHELHRVTRPKGWLCFEVGEVYNATVPLDELVVPLAEEAGWRCEAVMINAQSFTKTANIWGVGNNSRGTNSNRIVVLQK